MNEEMIRAKQNAKRELTIGFVWAGIMLVLAFGSVAAHRLGYVDRDLVMRLCMAPIGLWMVWAGNRLPKAFVRSSSARQAQRVSAWSQVLTGLAYAALWAFAPIQTATWYGTAVILAGMAITFGYCLSLPRKAKAG